MNPLVNENIYLHWNYSKSFDSVSVPWLADILTSEWLRLELSWFSLFKIHNSKKFGYTQIETAVKIVIERFRLNPSKKHGLNLEDEAVKLR